MICLIGVLSKSTQRPGNQAKLKGLNLQKEHFNSCFLVKSAYTLMSDVNGWQNREPSNTFIHYSTPFLQDCTESQATLSFTTSHHSFRIAQYHNGVKQLETAGSCTVSSQISTWASDATEQALEDSIENGKEEDEVKGKENGRKRTWFWSMSKKNFHLALAVLSVLYAFSWAQFLFLPPLPEVYWSEGWGTRKEEEKRKKKKQEPMRWKRRGMLWGWV